MRVVSSPEAMEREAARWLDEALSLSATLHEPGQREVYRQRLARAAEGAELALAALEGPEATAVRTRALATSARALAERAADARHGAGQLSLSAQRAPTAAACDDGWQRVASIVAVAEASARTAAARSAEVERDAPRSPVARAVRAAARKAETAARAARRIVEDRNDAFTFHADGGFSFGEGWYVAAAALLARAAIQIEPGKPATEQADCFLRDAGLGANLQPYRSRPRAPKQATDLVARAFAADPVLARRRVRAAFLGEAPIPARIVDWIDRRLLAGAPAREPPPASMPTQDRKKVLLWIRDGAYDAHRNTAPAELLELTERAVRAGLVPVWIGDEAPAISLPPGVVDLTLFWKDPLFGGPGGRRAQLQFFEHLRGAHAVVGQLGATTAGMDGPALMGLPTRYLTDAPNLRMRRWVGAVPGYEEIVRDDSHLDRVRDVLSDWAKGRR